MKLLVGIIFIAFGLLNLTHVAYMEDLLIARQITDTGLRLEKYAHINTLKGKYIYAIELHCAGYTEGAKKIFFRLNRFAPGYMDMSNIIIKRKKK